MRLSEIGGESGFLQRLHQTYGNAGESIVVGLGDDAAVLEPPAGRQLVVTSDMLIERIHFRREWSDPYSIGWKAAASNLSDLAAMGAKPMYAFLSLGFGRDESVENLDRMFDGFSDCLNRYGARIAGGDTNGCEDALIVSVTLIGSVEPGHAILRSGGRPGDALLVTGTLGDAAAGLALLTEYGLTHAEKIFKPLVSAHRRPQPRVVAAQAAARTGKVHAAMDISDGLGADLPKLCASSNVGARVDPDLLPITDPVRSAGRLLDVDPRFFAVSGGDDYELLLAVGHADVDTVLAAIKGTGTPVTAIGELTKSGVKLMTETGPEDLPPDIGWDHFSK
jgi:thiamine-monophosphate kinase